MGRRINRQLRKAEAIKQYAEDEVKMNKIVNFLKPVGNNKETSKKVKPEPVEKVKDKNKKKK